jgi:hypothetical protein
MEFVVSVQERLQILREATPNTWLAFSSDESKIVGRGNTFGDAASAAEDAGEQDPIIMLVPATWSPTLL